MNLKYFNFKTSKGFTLVELLISLGILSVISIISSQILVTLVSSSVDIQKKNEIELQYSFISQKLVKIISDGTNAVVSDNGNVLNISQGSNRTCFAIDTSGILKMQIININTPSCPVANHPSYTNKDLIDSNDIKIVKIPNKNYFTLVNNSNPQQIEISFKIEGTSSNPKSQDLERTITLRKTFKSL